MENSISIFVKTLASFCNHVESTTRSLSDSISRRPIPLESATSSFLNSLERRISSSTVDLNLLESMTLGSISFEELIGHCNEVYKTNEKYINEIEEKMISFGYVPDTEVDGEDNGEHAGLESEFPSPDIGSRKLGFDCGSNSGLQSNKKRIEERTIFDESLSLQDLGLSDACLAALALEENHHSPSSSVNSKVGHSHDDLLTHKLTSFQPPKDDSVISGNDVPTSMTLSSNDEISRGDFQSQIASTSFHPQSEVATAPDGFDAKSDVMIKISEDEYDGLPPYIQRMSSWEELQQAVAKLNNCFCTKMRACGQATIDQHDLEALDLGTKGRFYLLMLLRTKKIEVETVDGSIVYRPIG